MSQKVAIVGFALEGQSALEYFRRRGAEITICDQDPDKQVPSGIQSHLGPNYLDNLDQFDVIFRTAGINPQIILAQNPVAGKITTTMNEFLRECPTKNIIGVTGTKGKGTTSSLITKMLEAAGKQVFLGGNIGLSPFDFLDNLTEESWVVLELSSFQLIDIKLSTHIAVCLMVAPEHLNWHNDMDDYIQAKSRLFANQTADDIAIYFGTNETSQKIAKSSPGTKISYFTPPGAHIENDKITMDSQEICDVKDIKLLGQHNWQNACAAVTAVWQVTQNSEPVRQVLTTFAGLPHRLELIRELDDVKYYDDSFGTTPETAIVAIQAFSQPKVVILGGASKGTSFDELTDTVLADNVRHVVAIGDTGPEIAASLRARGFDSITEGKTTMQDIVSSARNNAQPGDIVLLSTGCASFGLFKDYKDRGNQFKQVVGSLS